MSFNNSSFSPDLSFSAGTHYCLYRPSMQLSELHFFDQSSNSQPSKDDNLIPLINIVFLLLIFFMLSGRFVEPEFFSVSVPVSQKGLVEQVQANEVVLIEISGDGQIAMNYEPVQLDKLQFKLREVLKSSADEAVTVQNRLPVYVKADATLSATMMVNIVKHLSEIKVKRIFLMTMANSK